MPNKRGIRSKKNRQRRTARRFIFRHSFNDYQQAETVNRVDWKQVEAHLQGLYDQVVVHDVDVVADDLVFGEILTDSRGKGSFQKVVGR